MPAGGPFSWWRPVWLVAKVMPAFLVGELAGHAGSGEIDELAGIDDPDLDIA